MPPLFIQSHIPRERIKIVRDVKTTIFRCQVILILSGALQHGILQDINPVSRRCLFACQIISHINREVVIGQARDVSRILTASKLACSETAANTLQRTNLIGHRRNVHGVIVTYFGRQCRLITTIAGARQVAIVMRIYITDSQNHVWLAFKLHWIIPSGYHWKSIRVLIDTSTRQARITRHIALVLQIAGRCIIEFTDRVIRLMVIAIQLAELIYVVNHTTVNDGARRCSCISRIWVVIKDTRFRIPLFIRVIDKACATNKFFRPDVFLTCSHYPAVPRRTILVQVAKYTVPYPLCVLLKYTFRLPALAIFLTIIFQAHRGITDFHPDSCPVSLIRSRSPISLIFTRVVIWVIVRFCAINGITSNTEPHVFVQTLDSDGNTIGIKRGCPLNQTLSRQDAVTQTALTRMPG